MKKYAIIKAGGSGTRFGTSIPKQFNKFNNKYLIEYSLEPIISSKLFDKIVIACNKEYINLCKKIFENSKNIIVIEGGESGLCSIINGINYISPKNEDLILIQESNRPFIKREDIIGACELNKDYLIGCKNVRERMILIGEDNTPIEDTSFKIAVHPEIYKQKFLSNLINNSCKDFKKCSSVVELLIEQNFKLNIFFFGEENIKITTKEDVELFKFYLSRLK